MIKKTFRFILILITLVSFISCSTPIKEVSKDKVPTYDFCFYSDSLSKKLFPEISNNLKSYKHFLEPEESKKLVNEVLEITVKYLEESNLYVSKIPTIVLFKLEGKKFVAFVLKVEIHFLDKESSYKNLVNTLIISKKFLVFFGPKKVGVGI